MNIWLLRHGRGPSRAVLLCAGAYVSGADGSNKCPAGSARIETDEACRTAAVAAGKTASPLGFMVAESGYPRGCYYGIDSNYAYFNIREVGAGRSGVQLLCVALATGARAPTR
jgi:hypothetical protein